MYFYCTVLHLSIMKFVSVIAIALVVFGSSGDANPRVSVISVNNGGPYGSWGRLELCPGTKRAMGFSIVVEPDQGRGDDTALNAIRLHCLEMGSFEETIIQSATGNWGVSHGREICTNGGNLTAFQLRVETPGSSDCTSANNINFRCDTGEILYGTGLGWGSWGEWSTPCPDGICGIQTKVEGDQGNNNDDTSLNDVTFLCC